MIITIICNFFAVFIASLASYSYKHKGYLFLSFLLIFIFLALRYDFGNDYMGYYEYFSKVQKASVQDIMNFQEYRSFGFMEFGFTWLNKLFPNFFLMVAVLSLFSCYVYYDAIKSYVIPYLAWVSVFMFVFDPYLMLVQSSAMRQTIAICFFIYSIRYLIERNFWKFGLLILIGSLFHKSAILLLPIYFLITPRQWNKSILIVLIIFYLTISLFGYLFLPLLENIVRLLFPQYHESYMTTIVGNPLNSGIGFLFLSLIFLFIIWSHNKGSTSNIIISKLSIVGFVLYPVDIYFNMFSRIGMYFFPVLILSLPFAISLQRSRSLRFLIVSIFILYYAYQFYDFFQSPIWAEKFSQYKINLIQGI